MEIQKNIEDGVKYIVCSENEKELNFINALIDFEWKASMKESDEGKKSIEIKIFPKYSIPKSNWFIIWAVNFMILYFVFFGILVNIPLAFQYFWIFIISFSILLILLFIIGIIFVNRDRKKITPIYP